MAKLTEEQEEQLRKIGRADDIPKINAKIADKESFTFKIETINGKVENETALQAISKHVKEGFKKRGKEFKSTLLPE